MSKPAKKPAPLAPFAKPPNNRPTTVPASLNPRQKTDLRWQRSKRYNWDGR